MKPSAEKGVIIVLDTLPELNVVRDVLHNRPFLCEYAKPYDPSTYRKSTQGRFADQALAMTYYGAPGSAPGDDPMSFIGVEEWKVVPSFEVRNEDADFVKASAEKVLAEKKPNELLFNLVTRRRKAAKAIVRLLNSTT